MSLSLFFVSVEDVLGKKWSHHVEGQRLKDETDKFRERLQPTKLFQNWLQEADKVILVFSYLDFVLIQFFSPMIMEIIF